MLNWHSSQFKSKSKAHLSLSLKKRTVSALTFLLFAITPLFALANESLIPSPPEINGSSYILIDAHSGQVLMSKNADNAIPPASLTKIMTSYVTEYEMEQGNISPDDLVPVSVKAWRKGGSKMYIKEGTKVKLSDLLKGIIIQSGNDASIAVAEYIAGSEDAFADLMNRHAARLGMTTSNFMNATGWPADGHYSSAKDLATLSRALIRDFPQHYSLYSERSFTYNGITQPNRNTLLNWNQNVDGIKTGHTEEAGYCLVASAQENGMRLISVITGTSSDNARATESQKMLTYGFRFFETKLAYPANAQIQTSQVWKGAQDEVNLISNEPVYLTYPRGQFENITQHILVPEQLEAPIAAGSKVGTIEFKLGEEVIATTDLVAQSSIEEGGFFSKLFDSIKLFFIGLFS